MKKRIAVFIGGRSPEHDVSVVTGLQAFQALDRNRFEPFIVYITLNGGWYIGQALESRDAYIPGPEELRKLTRVTLDTNADPMGTGRLIPQTGGGLFSKPKPVEFDVAFLGFHGLSGENGCFQGLFETLNIPYTGMRTMASAILMDKAATKRVLAGTNVPVLPYVLIDRPEEGKIRTASEIKAMLGNFAFPLIVKPSHLGSSIGVAKVDSVEEIAATLPSIFRLDDQVIVEPFVDNLVEYNVAVSAALGESVRTSAIERPKRADALLDFKQKYMSGGGGKSGPKSGGTKVPGQSSEGMLSLTRDINPELPKEIENNVRAWAETVFTAVGGSGAPRLDFLSNEKTGEVWFNEANPCPGSFGFFLWEAAKDPVLFSEFTARLIAEALALHRKSQIPPDPTLPEARLFPRPFNT